MPELNHRLSLPLMKGQFSNNLVEKAANKDSMRKSFRINRQASDMRKSSFLMRSNRDARRSHRVSPSPEDFGLPGMQQIPPYHAIKDVSMKDTWTLGPFSKFTFEEK